jgi:hypothetical protein
MDSGQERWTHAVHLSPSPPPLPCVQTTGEARTILHRAFVAVFIGTPPPPPPPPLLSPPSLRCPSTSPYPSAAAGAAPSKQGHDRALHCATESQLSAAERAFLASLDFV